MSTHSEFSDPAASFAPPAGAPKWLVALETAAGTAIEAAAALLMYGVRPSSLSASR
jgi:hypothetical protein